MTLAKLNLQHDSDKGDAAHAFAGVSFLNIYETYFAPIRGRVRTLLEIGIHKGQSLRLWRDYFPEATIWGLDINPATEIQTSRIQSVIGSQIDPGALAKVAPDEDHLDIVIDDGSHVVDHIVKTLAILWPRVSPGGFYVIEDTHATHEDIGRWSRVWPGQHLNPPETRFANSRAKFVQAMDARITNMDRQMGDFAFVHFYPRVVILKKALL